MGSEASGWLFHTRRAAAFFSLLFCWVASGEGYTAEDCDPWIARIVSAQGRVEVIHTGKTRWQHVNLDETLCAGDSVRIKAHSRAAIRLQNQTVLRLDAGTTITFSKIEPDKPSWLEMLGGAVHFITRVPRTLKIKTPFVNAAVEGTEFVISVDSNATTVWVFEGLVSLSNPSGSLAITNGEGAIAEAGKAPVRRIIVKPKEAVQWALYYPPLIDYRSFDLQSGAGASVVRDALDLYRSNDVPGALAKLDGLPAKERDAPYFILRAALLLSVGRVDEARPNINQALDLQPNNGTAFALLSIIALTQNDNETALGLAQQGAELEPRSPVPHTALAYAHQALFNIETALQQAQKAVDLGPNDALAWARLAELELSTGHLNRALASARKAAALDPGIERTQTVLGFAHLIQIDVDGALVAFNRAITLDSSAPLPRLGRGLARIRKGNLDAGTHQIEIAASLDPNNALIRSYLGKAYYEQKRIHLATTELEFAKQLDPNDPTAYFYGAILKQTTNRPVEALHDMQQAIELNDNRAVYRSRLLLDQDLAARTANIARIYDDIGFQQRALLEGWQSINQDPKNYSGHRFLADSYRALPRHEVARVSELLQAQLLQPINITPIQPQQGEANLLILEGAGPTNASFNEFNPLFARNRLALQAGGGGGSDSTWGNEAILSGIWNQWSASLGQFHFETDGFRANNDLKEDVLNAYTQANFHNEHSLQGEVRYRKTKAGDVVQRIRPEIFSPNFRRDIEEMSYRLGYHFNAAPESDVIASIIYKDRDETVRDDSIDTIEFSPDFPPLVIETEDNTTLDTNAFTGELQYLLNQRRFSLIAGTGYYKTDNTFVERSVTSIDGLVNPPQFVRQAFDIHNYNVYVYSHFEYPRSFNWTFGLNMDNHDDSRASQFDTNQLSPKFGLTWNPVASTTIRVAAFRVLKQQLVINETIQPTQVAGFNQFFDDFNGTDAYRYGAGLDQRFSTDVLGGLELTKRDLTVPTQALVDSMFRFFSEDRDEQLHRAYLYWTPTERIALSWEYFFEKFTREKDSTALFVNSPTEVQTHRLPLGFNYFHPKGFFTRWQLSYIDQDVEFPSADGGTDKFDDRFWLLDTALGYRFPRRLGIASVVVKNITDEEFLFQGTNTAADPKLHLFQPGRSVFVNVSLSF